jgi:hypothetical protein
MSAEVVRIRLPRRAFLLNIVSLTVSSISLTFVAWAPRAAVERGIWLRVAWGVLVAVSVAVVVCTARWRPGIDLRDDAAVVVTPFRRDAVPWRDVQVVAFGKGTSLTLYRADRTELRCPYPSHGTLFVSSKRVTADFHRVGRWWLAHRGPDWRPVFAPPPLVPASTPLLEAAPRPVEEIWRNPPEAQQ